MFDCNKNYKYNLNILNELNYKKNNLKRDLFELNYLI
jgi:hypothetical protein